MSWVLFGSGVGVLVLAFADRLPALHRLPPPMGAVKAPEVEFHVEGRDDLRFEMRPVSGPQNVILAVGLSNPNRHKIRETDLNVYVVDSGSISRCGQEGEHWASGGRMLRGPDGPYWTESDLKIARHYVMWFSVEIPRPGLHQIVLELDSPEFYETDGIEYRREGDMLHAMRGGERG